MAYNTLTHNPLDKHDLAERRRLDRMIALIKIIKSGLQHDPENATEIRALSPQDVETMNAGLTWYERNDMIDVLRPKSRRRNLVICELYPRMFFNENERRYEMTMIQSYRNEEADAKEGKT